jgi:hypothetical protein
MRDPRAALAVPGRRGARMSQAEQLASGVGEILIEAHALQARIG